MNTIQKGFNEISEKVKMKLECKNTRQKIFDLTSFLGKDRLFFNMEKSLTILIQQMITECLIEEYHTQKKNNDLKGNTVTDRTLYFLEVSSNEIFIDHFFNIYPLLEHKLSQSIYEFQQFTLEILLHLKNDFDELESIWEKRFGSLLALNISFGDKHDGKSVTILEFENEKVVYKPRNLHTDLLIFQAVEFVQKYSITKKNQLEFKFPKILNRQKYAWQEFIEHKECNSMNEVKKYYERAGIYLAVFFILGTTDLHYENLIASGEHPQFIDLETISYGKQNELIKKFKYKYFDTSVLLTNLLPVDIKNDVFDINLSGLFSVAQQSIMIKNSILEMHEEFDWIYRQVPFDFIPEQNQVKVNGSLIKPDKVLNFLTESFEKALHSIIDNKQEFLTLIQANTSSDMKIRQLLRPTRVYGKFLEFASSPAYLKSQNAQDKLFSILFKNFEASDFGYLRVDEEIKQLSKGNVPLFYSKPFDNHLYSSSVLICESYFQANFIEFLKEKLEHLNSHIVEYQKKLLEMSTASLYSSNDLMLHNNYPSEDYLTLTEANKRADNYLNYLCTYFIDYSDKSIEYYTLSSVGEKYSITTGSYGLYDTGGLILVLFQSKKHRDKALKLYNGLISKFHNDLQSIETSNSFPSVFTGIGGLLYISFYFYCQTKNKQFLDDFEMILDKIKQLLEKKDTEFPLDYLSGASGLLLLLANVSKEYKLDQKFIDNIGEKFMYHYEKSNSEIDGLAHGKTGFGIGLAALYYFSQSEKYYFPLVKVVQELAESLENLRLDSTWCKGKTGILAGLNVIFNLLESTEEVAQLIFCIFSNINNDLDTQFDQESNQLCLCHGHFGNLNVLLDLHPSLLKNKSAKISNLIQTKNKYPDIMETRWCHGMELIYDSFMMGAPGIVYTLQRLENREIPSIMQLSFS